MTKTPFIIAALAVALILGVASCSTAPAYAADPVCEYTYDAVKLQFEDFGSPVVEIDTAKIPAMVADLELKSGQDIGEVTRAFVANTGERYLLGLEVNGCLEPPIFLGFVQTAPGRSA
jgi:uncharacterized secreted protein with C-terminal beta-propeller domain